MVQLKVYKFTKFQMSDVGFNVKISKCNVPYLCLLQLQLHVIEVKENNLRVGCESRPRLWKIKQILAG